MKIRSYRLTNATQDANSDNLLWVIVQEEGSDRLFKGIIRAVQDDISKSKRCLDCGATLRGDFVRCWSCNEENKFTFRKK